MCILCATAVLGLGGAGEEGEKRKKNKNYQKNHERRNPCIVSVYGIVLL